jgi:hypothetical protein
MTDCGKNSGKIAIGDGPRRRLPPPPQLVHDKVPLKNIGTGSGRLCLADFCHWMYALGREIRLERPYAHCKRWILQDVEVQMNRPSESSIQLKHPVSGRVEYHEQLWVFVEQYKPTYKRVRLE